MRSYFVRLNSKNKEIEKEITLSSHKLEAGVPLAITFDEAVSGDEVAIKGFLVVDAFGTKANTRVTVMQAPAHRGYNSSLAAAVHGTDRVAKLVKGDIIAFNAAYVENGVARVGAVAARTDDFLVGKVQVLTAMAKPSLSKVTKKGASQSLIMADGKAASIVRKYDDIPPLFEKVALREWPGGSPGYIMRNRSGVVGEFTAEGDQDINFLIDELRAGEFLEKPNDLLEIIPIWKLPMGKGQVIKDVDPRTETPKPVAGAFTKKFIHKGARGFLPCLVVVADEEEWAFGGKTGQVIKTASSVVPVFDRVPVSAEDIPTNVLPLGGPVNTVLTLYNEQQIELMKKQRADRSGSGVPDKSAAGASEDRPKPFGLRR